MENNRTALALVLALTTPFVIGMVLFGDSVWWWIFCALLCAAFPYALARLKPQRIRKDNVMKIQALENYRPNIGWIRLFLLAFAFLTITGYVGAVLFLGYRFDPRLALFGVELHPLTYVFGIAFLTFWIQIWISRASGAKRFIDHIVSISMLIIIGGAIGVWANIPVVQGLVKTATYYVFRIPESDLVLTPDAYALAVAVIFGVLAVVDVFGRDILGIGRRSSAGWPSSAETIDQDAHEPLDIPSQTGKPFFRTRGPVVMDVDQMFLRFPNGRTIEMPITERMIQRIEWNMSQRALPSQESPPATPNPGAPNANAE